MFISNGVSVVNDAEEARILAELNAQPITAQEVKAALSSDPTNFFTYQGVRYLAYRGGFFNTNTLAQATDTQLINKLSSAYEAALNEMAQAYLR